MEDHPCGFRSRALQREQPLNLACMLRAPQPSALHCHSVQPLALGQLLEHLLPQPPLLYLCLLPALLLQYGTEARRSWCLRLIAWPTGQVNAARQALHECKPPSMPLDCWYATVFRGSLSTIQGSMHGRWDAAGLRRKVGSRGLRRQSWLWSWLAVQTVMQHQT